MKKTVLFLFLSLVMIGCKDEKNEKPSEKAAEETQMLRPNDHECLTLEQYDLLPTTEEKEDWLRKYGKAVCDNILFEATLKTHTIKTGEFTPNPSGSLKKDWSDIESMTKQYSVYDRYLSFDVDPVKKKINSIIIVPTFDKKISCYSLALLRAIAKENNGSNISFEFIYATIKAGKETIIMKVTDLNGKSSYYDYSDEPMKKNDPIIMRSEKSPL